MTRGSEFPSYRYRWSILIARQANAIFFFFCKLNFYKLLAISCLAFVDKFLLLSSIVMERYDAGLFLVYSFFLYTDNVYFPSRSVEFCKGGRKGNLERAFYLYEMRK